MRTTKGLKEKLNYIENALERAFASIEKAYGVEITEVNLSNLGRAGSNKRKTKVEILATVGGK